MSQLVGNYDADTLCDACLRLAETIEQGLLRDLVETLNKDGTGGDGTSIACISPEGREGMEVLPSPFLALMWLMECVKLFGVVFQLSPSSPVNVGNIDTRAVFPQKWSFNHNRIT